MLPQLSWTQSMHLSHMYASQTLKFFEGLGLWLQSGIEFWVNKCPHPLLCPSSEDSRAALCSHDAASILMFWHFLLHQLSCLIKSVRTPTVAHLTRLFKGIPLLHSPSLQRNKQDKSGSKIRRIEKAKKKKGKKSLKQTRRATITEQTEGIHCWVPSPNQATGCWEKFGSLLCTYICRSR